MIIVGLTGSIGMGKSTVGAMFHKLRIPLFDADALVHRLQGPGGALLASIEANFPGTTGANGVDRNKLSTYILHNTHKLALLESLVHPAVATERKQFLKRHRARPIVVLDIPLLFEKRGWRTVNVSVVVSAPAWVQRRRVLARANMTAAKFKAINRLQMPDAQKRLRADYIIETGHLRQDTFQSVLRLVSCLQAQKRRIATAHA